jgi:hypothetical protein
MTPTPVVFDPALLVFTERLTEADFVARVRFLAEWAKLARSGEVQVQISLQVKKSLVEGGYYPARSTVANTIETLGLRYRYAPEDVIAPINTLLSRAAGDLYCCIRDEAHDDFTSVPAQPWHDDPTVNEMSQRVLVLSSIEETVHEWRRILLASLLQAEIVVFSASLKLVDPDDIPRFEQGLLPKSIEGKALLVAGLEQVRDCLPSGEVWADSASNISIKRAIQFRCREILKAEGKYRSMVDIPEFYVGPQLYESLLTCQAARTAVLEHSTFEWRSFNKANRKADGAEPLRAHLTGGNMALRLMAWKRPTGRIEFANVGEKWDEETVYTDSTDAV